MRKPGPLGGEICTEVVIHVSPGGFVGAVTGVVTGEWRCPQTRRFACRVHRSFVSVEAALRLLCLGASPEGLSAHP